MNLFCINSFFWIFYCLIISVIFLILFINLSIFSMGLVQEFKAFAVKGNVIDLAVGVIIGGAFGKIVTSFVNDIVMLPIGYLTGGVDFSNLKYIFKEAVSINYGNFINIVIQFLIIAICIFAVIKGFNSLKKKAEDPQNPEAPTPQDILLLTEIRDLLKK